MGFIEWINKKTARPSEFGIEMAAAAYKGGEILGQRIYQSHGESDVPCERVVFSEQFEMILSGLKPHCDGSHLLEPLPDDGSALSRQTFAAAVAFLTLCASNSAFREMKRSNAEAFSGSMIEALQRHLPGSGVHDAFRFYCQAQTNEELILNPEAPGSGDSLGEILGLIKKMSGKTVGFVQNGLYGFGSAAVGITASIVEEVRKWSRRFDW